MREIKFRAWSGKRMCDVYTVFPFDKRVDTAEGYLDIKYIMQYTGLKDINGVDIYEGDIVNHNGIEDYDYPMEIRFLDGAFCIGKDVIGVSGFNSWTSIRDAMATGGYYGLDLKLEVIGNIYENGELLK